MELLKVNRVQTEQIAINEVYSTAFSIECRFSFKMTEKRSAFSTYVK